ncbi:helix-turn-helix domain-containing protein [Exilibacterium tricleocarpae]|uniref:Helix-turn-helix domain-containing protein n=1 Tax=Exilibacterium tricleocarpae TaxID=2591008 RepID=A0A545U9M9_9GAMM|nr:helix-turn-helix domain-containing protein [Exilibacterium tricleocarpae]TQV86123.1 helix-turn-helix domain-containing protein [Exilibacterium tricleocarpae]
MSPPTLPSALCVSLLAVPDASAAVVYSLHEVFSSVGRTWEVLTGQHQDARLMSPQIVAESKQAFRTVLGVPVVPDRVFAETQQSDIVIVADLALEDGFDPRDRWPQATAWLREEYERGAIICSVCTGALMLAEAGLLNRLEATTHWSVQKVLQNHYPEVVLKAERVLSPAGPEHRIVTSGGSASWSDLALYLIARFSGKEEARRIAKIFLFGDRRNGQLPFAAMARPKQHNDAVIARCQSWIASHYAVANPVECLVEQSGLAGRTFARRFKAATGYAPLDYVQTLRIEEAKQMLESTHTPVDAVALGVGYDDAGSFRRLFKRCTGISPSAYRQRFQGI